MIRSTSLLAAAVSLFVLVLVPAAFAAPPQNDTVFVRVLADGSPTTNGCPASSYLVASNPADNSTDPSAWGYGAARLADANGNGLACAKPLTDADRDNHFPGFGGIAFYDFVDDALPAAR